MNIFSFYIYDSPNNKIPTAPPLPKVKRVIFRLTHGTAEDILRKL